MLTGTILKGVGGFYHVKAGNEVYVCKARGIFRKENITPLPGDKVYLEVLDEKSKTGNITQIMPRSSQLVRPAVANVNQLAAVIAVKAPDPDFLLLDKLLLIAKIKGIDAFICINKIDLASCEEYEKIKRVYVSAGYRAILLSSVAKIGFDALRNELKDRVTVFAGQSGVGKSTILNTIMDSRIMETGEVSAKINRGRHTTRHAELVELSTGGYVVDTPGFSSLELDNIADVRLELYYPEFDEYLNKCRFKSCSHISEPGCLVRQALEAGKIDRGRYDRYVQFYSILKELRNNRYKTKK